MIVYLGTDLMMASAIGAVARSAGRTMRSVTHASSLLELMAGQPRPSVVIINLQTPGLEIGSLAAAIGVIADRNSADSANSDAVHSAAHAQDSDTTVAAGAGASGPTSIIWFAQHVETGLLDQVRATGIGTVMTRGQLNHRLPELV